MPFGPPLDARTIQVYRALFEAQIDHTVDLARRHLRDWNAVQIQLDTSGSTKIIVPKEKLRETLLARMRPWGIEHNPAVLELRGAAAGMLVTIMPHEELPKRMKPHEGWKYLAPTETHARMTRFSREGRTVLDDWAGKLSTPTFQKLLRDLPAGGVTLYDSEFGHSGTMGLLIEQADRFLHHFDRKADQIFFDDEGRWHVHFDARGSMKVIAR